MLRLLQTHKGLAVVEPRDCSTILLWKDLWAGAVPKNKYPELYSFAKNKNISLANAKQTENIHNLFHLPLSEQAYDQLQRLQTDIERINETVEHDTWSYIWGNSYYSSAKAYKSMKGHNIVHNSYKWTWSSSCQPKHKFFFLASLVGQIKHKGNFKKKKHVPTKHKRQSYRLAIQNVFNSPTRAQQS